MDWLTGVSVSRPWLLQSGDTVCTLHAVSERWTEWFSDGLIDWHFPLQTTSTSSWARCLCLAYCVWLMGWAMDWLIDVPISRPRLLPAGQLSDGLCILCLIDGLIDWCFCLQTMTALEWARCLHLACKVWVMDCLIRWWTDWFSDGLIDWHFPLQTVTTSSWARCPTCWTWGPRATRSCQSGRRWLQTPRCATWSCPQSGPRSPASTLAPRRSRTSSPSTLSPVKKVCGRLGKRKRCVFGGGGGA